MLAWLASVSLNTRPHSIDLNLYNPVITAFNKVPCIIDHKWPAPMEKSGGEHKKFTLGTLLLGEVFSL
jgi:hypothetical protein